MMKPIMFSMTLIFMACVFSTSVAAEPFDVWKLTPHGMATFIWTQHGDPELTQHQQEILKNSIENDFSLAGEYYPTPTQLADFYMTWFAGGYPGDREELQASIIAYESIEVSQEQLSKAVANNKLDYVRRKASCPRCPSDLLRDGVIRVCNNPKEGSQCRLGCTPWCDSPREISGRDVAYEVVNRKEFERLYNRENPDPKIDLKNFEIIIRNASFVEKHPNKQSPSVLTRGMRSIHIREYGWDRDEVFAGVIMENIIN